MCFMMLKLVTAERYLNILQFERNIREYRDFLVPTSERLPNVIEGSKYVYCRFGMIQLFSEINNHRISYCEFSL